MPQRAQLDELLHDVVVVEKTEHDDRLVSVLTDRSRVDVATAQGLHNQIRQIDLAYETTSSASLLAAAGHCHALLSFAAG